MAKINSKNKGSSNERELAKILNERFGEGLFRRNAYSGSLSGGQNRQYNMNLTETQKQSFSADIISPDEFLFTIEHKAYKNPFTVFDLVNKSSDILSFFKQVSEDAEYANRKPLLVIKYNRKERIAFIKEKPIENYILKTKGWYCYWFDDLLKLENNFWFKE